MTVPKQAWGAAPCLLAGLMLAAPAGRAAVAQGTVCDVLKSAGPVLGDVAPDGTRHVAVTVDAAALFAQLPILQEQGAISKSITRDELDRHPASSVNVLSMLLTTCAVRGAYSDDPALDRTLWTVSLNGSREIYSFAFDRRLDQHTQWKRLRFTDFPRVANQFSYNLRFTQQMSHEAGGIGDD